MGELKLATQRNDYVSSILTSLHIEISDFIKSILRPEGNYERQLHEWILQLYRKGKTKEQAVEIIYETRRYFLTRKDPIAFILSSPTDSLQKILIHRLESNLKYRQLRPLNQFIVQERIIQLMQMENAIDIVKQVQHSNHPLSEIEKINNIMIKGNTLLVTLKSKPKTSVAIVNQNKNNFLS